MSSTEPLTEEALRAARNILRDFVCAKSAGSECVDGAFESIIHASETYRDHPRHDELLFVAWRRLAWNTTTLARQKPAASASLFDAYLGLADYITPKKTRLPVAHLHLHHPTTPTHDRALDYFASAWAKFRGNCGRSILRREAAMGIDAVSHLGLVGKLKEAERLMDFIQQKYAFVFYEPESYGGNELLDHLEPKLT